MYGCSKVPLTRNLLCCFQELFEVETSTRYFLGNNEHIFDRKFIINKTQLNEVEKIDGVEQRGPICSNPSSVHKSYRTCLDQWCIAVIIHAAARGCNSNVPATHGPSETGVSAERGASPSPGEHFFLLGATNRSLQSFSPISVLQYYVKLRISELILGTSDQNVTFLTLQFFPLQLQRLSLKMLALFWVLDCSAILQRQRQVQLVPVVRRWSLAAYHTSSFNIVPYPLFQRLFLH